MQLLSTAVLRTTVWVPAANSTLGIAPALDHRFRHDDFCIVFRIYCSGSPVNGGPSNKLGLKRRRVLNLKSMTELSLET